MNNKNSVANRTPFKIACCISGYPNNRVLEHLLHLTKYKHIFDFFVFFWDVIDEQMKVKISSMIQPKDIQYEKPIKFPFDAVHKEPDKLGHKNDALSMFYGISKVQMMRKNYEQKNNKTYDLVMRFRYDIHLISDISTIVNDVTRVIQKNTAIFPWERHHIGICDQLWIGHPDTMDNFINLFEWIHLNIKSLFFVNESVLYKFMCSCHINIKCVDIKYVLRREHLIKTTETLILRDYEQQLSLPWIMGCPERIDGKYQRYINDKNNSASNIYFLSEQHYSDKLCKLYNKTHDKYLNIVEKNSSLICITNNVGIPINIHTHNSYTINLVVLSECYSKNKVNCISIDNECVVLSSEINDPSCHFLLIEHTNPNNPTINVDTSKSNDSCAQTPNYTYQFILYIPENNKPKNVKQTMQKKYIAMNNRGSIYSSHDSTSQDTYWTLFYQ